MTSDGASARMTASLPAGAIIDPRWFPRGDLLRFTVDTGIQDRPVDNIWEVRADGTGLRRVLAGWKDAPTERQSTWVLGGRYFVFASLDDWRTDLWAMREQSSLIDWTHQEPTRLTQDDEESFGGPLVVSPDGATIFTTGWRSRGELVRSSSEMGVNWSRTRWVVSDRRYVFARPKGDRVHQLSTEEAVARRSGWG